MEDGGIEHVRNGVESENLRCLFSPSVKRADICNTQGASRRFGRYKREFSLLQTKSLHFRLLSSPFSNSSTIAERMILCSSYFRQFLESKFIFTNAGLLKIPTLGSWRDNIIYPACILLFDTVIWDEKETLGLR